MEKFRNLLEETFNSGDPEASTWFLVRSNYLPFILCGVYVFFATHLGPAIMQNTKPFHLRRIMIFYNFSLVFVYIVCLFTALWSIQYLTPEQICKEVAVKKGEASYVIIRSIWFCYILKYVQFLDTVFFVLRKNENLITLFHVFHHACTPIVFWILFRTENSGTAAIPAGLNIFENIILYFYYGLAAMGPSVKKHLWWKKYVTYFQMVIFLLTITHVTVVAPLMGCKIGFFTYFLFTTFPLLLLYLFYRLYVTNFKSTRVKYESIDEISLKKRMKKDISTNIC